MESISLTTRFFSYLGDKVGENQRQVFENVGSAVITPTFMFLSPNFDKKTSIDEKLYQALRQPIAGMMGLITAFSVTVPLGKLLDKLSILGKLPENMRADISIKNHTAIGCIERIGKLLSSNKQAIHSLYDIRFPKPFLAYKQMFQFVAALITVPFASILTNIFFPPFVRVVNPALEKSVRTLGERKRPSS